MHPRHAKTLWILSLECTAVLQFWAHVCSCLSWQGNPSEEDFFHNIFCLCSQGKRLFDCPLALAFKLELLPKMQKAKRDHKALLCPCHILHGPVACWFCQFCRIIFCLGQMCAVIIVVSSTHCHFFLVLGWSRQRILRRLDETLLVHFSLVSDSMTPFFKCCQQDHFFNDHLHLCHELVLIFQPCHRKRLRINGWDCSLKSDNLNIFLALVFAQLGSLLCLPIQHHGVDTIQIMSMTFDNGIILVQLS